MSLFWLVGRFSSENCVLRKLVFGSRDGLFGFVTPATKDLERPITKAVPTGTTALIAGESGAGKDVIEHQVHQQGGARPTGAENEWKAVAVPFFLLQ